MENAAAKVENLIETSDENAGAEKKKLCNPLSPNLFTRIFGISPSYGTALAEFLTTYIISVISAALGLAKCLKNGVARPIAPGGALDGLLSGKFLLAFLASAVVLVTRGVCIAISLVNNLLSFYLSK